MPKKIAILSQKQQGKKRSKIRLGNKHIKTEDRIEQKGMAKKER